MVPAASAVTRLCAGAILMEAGLGLDGAVLATVLGQLVVPALVVAGSWRNAQHTGNLSRQGTSA